MRPCHARCLRLLCICKVDNVSLSYQPQSPAVLHSVSCFIPAGAKVAVVGPSGAGKSTLFLALLRMYPLKGTIRIAGKDIAGVSVPVSVSVSVSGKKKSHVLVCLCLAVSIALLILIVHLKLRLQRR